MEYEAVATRPEPLEASGLTANDVMVVIDALATVMEPVPIRWRLRPTSPDPNDDFVLEAAWNAGATILVTEHQRDLEAASATFGVRTVLTISPNTPPSDLRSQT